MKTMQNCDPKFKILTISFLMLLGCFGLAKTSLAATPAISNVSGTVATGQTLTISGANMMDEDKTDWDSFFTTHPNAYGFEGTSPGTAGQCDGDCYCDLGPCYGTYDSSVKLSGNKSIKFEVAGAHSENLGSYNAYTPNISNNKWYRFYARWYSNQNLWPDGWIKLFYTSGGGGVNLYFEPSYTNGTALPSEMFIQDTGNTYVSIPSGQLQNDRWYCFEVHSTSNTVQIWMDGVQIYSNDNAATGQQMWLFGMVNECCNSNFNFALSNWIDGLMDSSTRIYPSSTIEIANSSNYSTATKVYQEPLYLSDGSVQIKSDLAGLGDGPYYLFVTNNRQETSAAYALSGGDGGDTTPPAAPSGLQVQ